MAAAADVPGATPGRGGDQGAKPAPPSRLELSLDAERLDVPVGRSLVHVTLPLRRFVSVVVTGPREALLGWDVQAADELGAIGAHEALNDDGKLPAVLSFVSPEEPRTIVLVVEVSQQATLWRVSADPDALEAPAPRDLKLGKVQPRPLIGLPVPTEKRDGYVLQAPQRYLFLRLDIAVALRKALRQTHIRFRRNALAVGDASQWNGHGPGSDRGKSQHIGHKFGTEVDIGLPSDDDSPSVIERRCEGVMIEPDELVCAPGTVRHVDAQRLAYFLGLLLDGPTPNGIYLPEGRDGPIAPVLSILTDQAYVDEIRKAAERLRKRRWIHDEGYGALVEEGLLRPSSWHTDHVHLRFAGEQARVLVP